MLIHTEIEIAASPERVWDILADFAAYPDWNPMIPRVDGYPEAGSTANIRLALGKKVEVPISVEVLIADPGRELCWVGPAPAWMRRVASGTHYFRIDPLGDERVLFGHGEEFVGLFLPRQFARGERLLARAYGALNRALKRRAEA